MKNERMLDLSLLGENNHRQLFSNTSVVVVVQSISASAINSFHRRRAGQIFVKSEEAKSLVDVSRLTFWSLSAYAVSYRFMSDLRRAFYTRQCSLIWSYVNWRIESNSLRLRVCSRALCFFVLLNRVSNEHLNMINEPYGHYALKSKIDALSRKALVSFDRLSQEIMFPLLLRLLFSSISTECPWTLLALIIDEERRDAYAYLERSDLVQPLSLLHRSLECRLTFFSFYTSQDHCQYRQKIDFN